MTSIPGLVRKSFDTPDATQQFPGVNVESVTVGDLEVRRFTVEPGWVWSESVGPSAGADSCHLEHVIWMVLAWRFAVKMNDGRPKSSVLATLGPYHRGTMLG